MMARFALNHHFSARAAAINGRFCSFFRAQGRGNFRETASNQDGNPRAKRARKRLIPVKVTLGNTCAKLLGI